MVTTQLCNLVNTVKIVSDIIQELLFYVNTLLTIPTLFCHSREGGNLYLLTDYRENAILG